MLKMFKVFKLKLIKNFGKPFKKAFETTNGVALNKLYADEVLRVTPNGIDTESKFKEANLKRFESYRKNHTSIRLDFWFDSRTKRIHQHHMK